MEDEDFLKVSDRVLQEGRKWIDPPEPDRIGTVVECYQGVPSAVSPGLDLFAVKWDNGPTERGFIQKARTLKKIHVIKPAPPGALQIPIWRTVDENEIKKKD